MYDRKNKSETPIGRLENLVCVKVELTNAIAIIALTLNRLLNLRFVFTDSL